MAMIEIKNISKSFPMDGRSVAVLKDMNFLVKEERLSV